MEEEIRARLVAHGPLAAMVGARIAWGLRPQGDPLPAVTLQLVSGQRHYQMAAPAGLKDARVQVDCWAATYAGAKAAARAVVAALGGYRGGAIQGAFVASERDEVETDARESMIFRSSLDVIVWAQEGG